MLKGGMSRICTMSRWRSTRVWPDKLQPICLTAFNGCYRVEDGLLKVTMLSRAGKERTVVAPPKRRVKRFTMMRWGAVEKRYWGHPQA